jgi:hypothetical protein
LLYPGECEKANPGIGHVDVFPQSIQIIDLISTFQATQHTSAMAARIKDMSFAIGPT